MNFFKLISRNKTYLMVALKNDCYRMLLVTMFSVLASLKYVVTVLKYSLLKTYTR